MKQCSQCKQQLPKDQFSEDNSRKDKLCYRCKDCVKKNDQKNKEKSKIQHQKYNQANAAEIAKKRKEYDQKNVDRIKARRKIYNEQHKKERATHNRKNYLNTIEYRRIHQRNYRKQNSEKVKAQDKKWRQNNPGKCRMWRAKRRAVLLQRTPKWLTKVQLKQIENFYINCPKGMVVDHIYPLQGKYVSGLHHPDNLQYLTLTENSIKQNRYPEIDDLWKEENIG